MADSTLNVGESGRIGSAMAKPLTVKKITALSKPGRFGDGGGLYLEIAKGGSKSWVQRITVDGRRRDIGLGGFPAVSLAMARQRAAGNRTAVADGRDPLAERRKSKGVPSFQEVSESYLLANAPRWKNRKTAINWRGQMEKYAYPVFGQVRIDRVDRIDVLGILTPIWTSKPAAGRKLRQRIRAVFAFAMAHGYVGFNPAGEIIGAALPPMPSVKSHFRALPYQEVGVALRMVEASSSSLSSRLCFRFLVLTAARSGEAREATWDEVDMHDAVWTIPGNRMKAGAEHRVPLVEAALEVLTTAQLLDDGSNLVFPSLMKPRHPLSDMTLTKLLRDLGLAERATVHGFRTSFKTWCMEQTNTPWAVGEAALAHTIGNSTEAAYARSDLFKKRRKVMQQWADYLLG